MNQFGEQELIQGVLAGERLALTRLLTLIENDTPIGRAALDGLYPLTGKAYLVGVTGSPGTGKSTLVNQLVRTFRAEGEEKVAVIAVDPSSPFSGGALLGDRIRMRDLAGDPGVFIRSMASRGALGGLSRATASVAQALDAAGYGMILIETVGAGQSDVDIARVAHTVVVVETPGYGDEIQASKAGLLEIADILVVNKCDLPGADQTARVLQAMLEMARLPQGESQSKGDCGDWLPPVLLACSTNCRGLDEIMSAIRKHQNYLEETGERDRRDQERLRNMLEALLRDSLLERWKATQVAGALDQAVAGLIHRRISPFEAVERLLDG